jgi:hypothetical protein
VRSVVELIEQHLYRATLPRNRKSPREYKIEHVGDETLVIRYGWFRYQNGKSASPDDPWTWSPRGLEEIPTVDFQPLADLGISPEEGDQRSGYSRAHGTKRGSSAASAAPSPEPAGTETGPPEVAGQSDDPATEKFEDLLRKQITHWRRANPSSNWSKLSSLSADEISGFRRALDAGIANLDSTGKCHLYGIRAIGRRPTQPQPFVLAADGSIRVPWREFITQLAGVAELILDYGWASKQVALDPDNWEFDIAAYEGEEGEGEIVVAGEAKKSATELIKTVDQMLKSSSSAAPPLATSRLDGDKKYLGLLKYRPQYFWAVAPGVRRAFRITYRDNQANMEEVPDLPRNP